MRFVSLFAGIGGIDLGLERAGMTCVGQVELDPYCRKVLAKHWPNVWRHDDVKTLTGDLIRERCGHVDILAGGFPCQPVSNAGRRKVQDDARWLWPEFARLLRELRPRLALLENVTGLLDRGIDEVLGDLAACGRDAEWDCVPAAAVRAPHLRDRVFVVSRLRLADTSRNDRECGGYVAERKPKGRASPGRNLPDVSDASISRLPTPQQARIFGTGRREEGGAIAECDWWTVEPDVDRVAHGVPDRVDRLKGLGNAVVPQVAEWVGRRIVEAEQ